MEAIAELFTGWCGIGLDAAGMTARTLACLWLKINENII
jgi:hypothetical protein